MLLHLGFTDFRSDLQRTSGAETFEALVSRIRHRVSLRASPGACFFPAGQYLLKKPFLLQKSGNFSEWLGGQDFQLSLNDEDPLPRSATLQVSMHREPCIPCMDIRVDSTILWVCRKKAGRRADDVFAPCRFARSHESTLLLEEFFRPDMR